MQSTDLEKFYTGPLSKLCADFINYKRSLGRKYDSEMLGMKRFDQFTIMKNYETDILSKELVDDFVKIHPHETQRNSTIRRILMKQFALYLTSLGLNVYILPDVKRKTVKAFTPYVFSDSEMLAFFNTLDHLQPMMNSPHMHLVLPVLFRILYCCGLRISEALNLRLSDVNLKDGILTVRNSKFDNERLIPMSASLHDVCSAYYSKLHHHKCPNDYFFPAHDNTNMIRQDVVYHFRKQLWESAISYRGKGIGPRIHDFRHTFAVNSLRKCVAEGRDVYTSLPILSVFLGHKSVAATQVYLRLTADSYPDIIQLVEKQSSRIFPEVE